MPRRATRWTLQDAKAQFSEVVRRAVDSGPQVVTRNGEETVVVISVREHHRLTRTRTGESLAQRLAESPLADVDLDVRRPSETGRPVKL